MQHEMVSHLGLTHISMEGVIIATQRQFSRDHLLYKLLEHHLQFTLAINNLGMLIIVLCRFAFH
jgi:arachidonate 15-lipoxygenase